MALTSDTGTRPLKRITVQELETFCINAMKRHGISGEDAGIIADVLVTTDTWGIHTHGTKQLRPLLKLCPERIDPKAVPEVLAEGQSWAIVDGHYAMAIVTSYKAMEIAIQKAKGSGVGYVGVRNGNHFGAAGYYANMAQKKDMLGMSFCNTNPLVTVPGGKTAILGTNPFSYAVPAGREKPILFDIATSVVSGSKVLAAKTLGRKIPDNWLVDGDGLRTTDPSRYPETGALLPMAGHKGYGIALLVEILAAVLTGAGIMNQVKLWLEDGIEPINQGHCFIAIDVGAIMPIDQFKERMDCMIREVKESPKASGSERIYLPGEKELENREMSLVEGLLLPDDVICSLKGMADDLRLETRDFFNQSETL